MSGKKNAKREGLKIWLPLIVPVVIFSRLWAWRALAAVGGDIAEGKALVVVVEDWG